MRHSLKLKSSFFLALLLIATVFLLAFLILRGIKEDQQNRQIAYLQEQSNIANVYVEQAMLSDPVYQKDYISEQVILQKNAQMAMQLGTIIGMKATIYDTAGKTIDTLENHPTVSPEKKLVAYALNNQIAYQTIGDTLYYVSPLNNSADGAIAFEYPLQDSKYFYNNIKNLFLQVGSLVVGISFLIAYLYFYRITNGILRLKEATDQIEQGNYHAVVPLKRSDELGKLSKGVYSMSHRISENVQTMQQEQEKLRLAVDKLKQLEAQQKTFIENITHEFKTPLSIILAYMDLLEMYKDDTTLVEDARGNVKKEAKRLYDMVEKVLHLASFEKYDFELQREQVAVQEVLQDLADRMSGKAQKFDVTITTQLQPASIWIDRESLYLIFINLLDNAIKYNVPSGTISLISEVIDDQVHIHVIDTGIGIPEDAIEQIFEPFYIVNKDRSKQSGGTGLGLALVKQLVEKQDGTISLASTDQQGTTVSLSLPLYQKN